MDSPLRDLSRKPTAPSADGTNHAPNSPTSPADTDHEHDEDDIFGNLDAHRSLLGGGKVRRAKGPSSWAIVRRILAETCPTLLFTTVGMVFAGELLEQVSSWRAFRKIDELLILVPILINLKGNIEMNLSARLSTSANIGALDTAKARRTLVVGNLWLLQVQALAVSAVAAGVSFGLGGLSGAQGKAKSMMSRSGFMEFLMVLSCAMWSASLSAVLLGSFMCALVIVCRHLSLDPDNITSPLAACLGDLLTLALLSLLATMLLPHVASPLPLLLSLSLCAVGLLALWRTRRCADVRPLLAQGWSALFAAMAISAVAGMVLDWFVSSYEGFGMMAIVIGGVPGSVGSVFVSRISTALHAADAEDRPDARPVVVGATLLAVSLPVALLYLLFVWAVGWMALPAVFVVFFVFGFIITTALSLLVAYYLTHFFWRRQLDPDTYCLPIQSSIVDLIGPTILVVCYELAQACGALVVSKHHHHQ